MGSAMAALPQDRMLQAGKRPLSFLQAEQNNLSGTSGDNFAVKISMIPIPPADPKIKTMMDKIEDKRANAEMAMLEQACKEMQSLTDIVLHELGAQLHSHVSAMQLLKQPSKAVAFLEHKQPLIGTGLPVKANVRIASSTEAFPTIAEMVQDMEMRRNKAENQETSVVLEMQLQLLQAENVMIKEVLNSAIHRISA